MSRKHATKKKERPVPGTDEYYVDPRRPIWPHFIGIVLALSLCGVGLAMLWSSIDAGLNTESADGTVVDFKLRRNHRDDTAYEKAVVRYSVDGHTYRCEGGWMSGWLLSYDKGDRVRVLYKIDDPKCAVIDNFSERWWPATFVLVIGSSIFAVWVRYFVRHIQNKRAATRKGNL